MKAFVCRELGPVESHRPGELPVPEIGPGELLVRVAAAGVNFFDTLIVQGKYQIRPPLPFAPGGEISGVVEAVGEGAGDFRPGDRVLAFTSFGGYAELTRAKASMCWHLPDAVSFETGAAGLTTYGTAWFSLHDLARLQPGESVLVLGAAGGVGLAAIQIAKLAGARVIAAASGPERLEVCREAGADQGIDYLAEDLREAVKGLTGGRGADVVIDVVGGEFTEKAVRAVAWRGRVMVIGFAAGSIPRIACNLLLLKGCHLIGVFWDEMLRREPQTSKPQIDALTAAWADGRLRPPVTRTYPLARAGEAMQQLAGRRTPGKLLVVPSA